jgi:hypothetical protein
MPYQDHMDTEEWNGFEDGHPERPEKREQLLLEWQEMIGENVETPARKTKKKTKTLLLKWHKNVKLTPPSLSIPCTQFVTNIATAAEGINIKSEDDGDFKQDFDFQDEKPSYPTQGDCYSLQSLSPRLYI